MSAPQAATAIGGALTHRQKLWIVFGVLVPVMMASLDQTIVASALPTIGRDLGDPHLLSWVVAGYLLTTTAATPLFGKISDTRGRRFTLAACAVIFIAGAVASALARNMIWLLLARALQGIGNAGLVSTAMTVLGDVATPKERARYYTYFSIVYTSAGAIGPLLGGFFAQYVHWSAAFWIAVPLGALSLACIATLLDKLPRHERPHRLDLIGATLIVAASSTFMFILNSGGRLWPWLSWQTGALAFASAFLWFSFARRLNSAPEPLIPLHVLRNPIVRMATIANASGWGAVICLNLYLPVYLQAVLGMGAAQAGLAMMVVMVTVNSGAMLGSHVAARATHYKTFPLATFTVSVAAMLWLALRVDRLGVMEFEIVLAVLGLGFGPMAPVTTVATQNAVKLSELGAATAMMSLARSLYAAILAAALGAVVLHTLGGPAERGAAMASALAQNREAAATAFRVMFLLTSASFLLSWLAFWRMEERPLLDSNEGREG